MSIAEAGSKFAESGLGTTAVEQKSSTKAALDSISDQAEVYFDRIAQLRNRLHPYLKNEDEVNPEPGSPVNPALSDLAQALWTIAGKLNQANDYLLAITGRIDA